MLNALLTVVLPVLLILSLGALAGRFLKLDNGTINRLNLYLLTPVLAFNSLLHLQARPKELTLLVLGYYLLALIGVLLGYLAAFRQPDATRRAVMASVAIGNNGNYGLPVALFALGQAGFEQALVIYLSSVLLTFTAGPLIFGGGGGLLPTLRGVFRLPVVWSIAAALLLRAADFTLPTGLDRGLGLLAGATLPMVLLSLGLHLGTAGRPKLSCPGVAGLRAAGGRDAVAGLRAGLRAGLAWAAPSGAGAVLGHAHRRQRLCAVAGIPRRQRHGGRGGGADHPAEYPRADGGGAAAGAGALRGGVWLVGVWRVERA